MKTTVVITALCLAACNVPQSGEVDNGAIDTVEQAHTHKTKTTYVQINQVVEDRNATTFDTYVADLYDPKGVRQAHMEMDTQADGDAYNVTITAKNGARSKYLYTKANDAVKKLSGSVQLVPVCVSVDNGHCDLSLQEQPTPVNESSDFSSESVGHSHFGPTGHEIFTVDECTEILQACVDLCESEVCDAMPPPECIACKATCFAVYVFCRIL